MKHIKKPNNKLSVTQTKAHEASNHTITCVCVYSGIEGWLEIRKIDGGSQNKKLKPRSQRKNSYGGGMPGIVGDSVFQILHDDRSVGLL